MNFKRNIARLAVVGTIGAAGFAGFTPKAEAATVVTTLYQFANHVGQPQDVLHASNGFVCTATVNDFDAWAYYPASITWFMNDNTSSYRTFAACYAKLWDVNNFTVALQGFAPSKATLPFGVDNRTSAVDAS
jgi:hypothetical protein